jgi:hypothetical protein
MLRFVNPCRACSHPDRTEIDVALLSGTVLRKVAARYGLNLTSLYRHAKNHARQPQQTFCSAGIQPGQAQGQAEQPKQPQSTSLAASTGSNRLQRSGTPAWERQSGESRPAFTAFQKYLELSAIDPANEATYDQVASAVGKNRSLISRWGRVLRGGLTWRQRRDAWLAHVDRAKAARLLLETEKTRERWRLTGRNMRILGTQRIMAINPSTLPVDEARRFVMDGATLESKGLGLDGRQPLPSGRVTLTDGQQIEVSEFRRLVCSVYTGLQPDSDKEEPPTVTLEREREKP